MKKRRCDALWTPITTPTILHIIEEIAEVAAYRCSSKQVFLKIVQISQENSCDGVSF